MKRAGKIIVCFVLVFFVLTGIASAKLVVLSPDEMVKQAPYIIVGEIRLRKYTREYRKVIINVKEELKGNIPEEQITMQYKESKLYGWLGADFPPPGTKVLLFLAEAEGSQNKYTLYGDLNNVGVINKDETVNLHKGAQVNNMTPKNYEEVYTKLLKGKYKQDNVPKTANREEDIDRTGKYSNTLLLITGLVFGLVFITFAVVKLRKK